MMMTTEVLHENHEESRMVSSGRNRNARDLFALRRKNNVANIFLRFVVYCLFPIAFSALLIACGSTSFYVPVRKPAEVNLLAYKRIAVSDFVQDIQWRWSRYPYTLSQDVADEITRELLRTGKFDVIDQRLFDLMPKEQRPRDIGNPKDVVPSDVGRFGAPTCLLTGRISQCKYEEDTKSVEVRRRDKPSAMNNIRHGLVRMEVVLQVSDFASGKIIWNKRFRSQVEANKEAIDAKPAPIDEDILRTQAQTIIVQEFMQSIVPTEERISVTMLIEDEMPLLAQGVAQAKLGKWDEAIETFTNATIEYMHRSDNHQAWFNLGVAHQYSYDFRKAEEAYKKALALKDETRYKRQLQDCYAMESEYLRLLQQEKEMQ